MNLRSSLDQADRYCVFQSGTQWFAFPSLVIRSVVPRPPISRVPFCDPILKGVAHVQNEFVPVLSLRGLMEAQHETSPDQESQLMVLIGPQGSWGLLIDRALALAPLELSISNFADANSHWSRVVLGSASYANHVLQVLDAASMNEYAAELLHGFWQTSPC